MDIRLLALASDDPDRDVEMDELFPEGMFRFENGFWMMRTTR